MGTHSLSCEVEKVGGDVVIHLTGDLLVSSTMILAEELYRQKHLNPERIIIDLMGLTMLDSAGFAFLKANRMMFSGGPIMLQITGLAPRLIAQLELKGEDRNLMESWIEPYGAGAREEVEAPEPPEPRQPPTDDPSRPQLLVVDRDKLVLKYVSTYLKLKGFGVFKAQDEEEALELLRDTGIEVRLVLLDFSMGMGPSRDLIEKMARIQPDLKIILMCGMSEALGDTSHPNVVSRLAKPIFGDRLVSAIREALE